VVRSLEERISSLPGQEGALAGEEESRVKAVAATKSRVAVLQNAVDAAAARVAQAQLELQRADSAVKEWDAAVRELLDGWASSSLVDLRRELTTRRRQIQDLRTRSDEIARELRGSIAQSQIPVIETEEGDAAHVRAAAVTIRDAASSVERQLRKVASDSKAAELDIVEAAITSHMPTLRALYRRLNPSPLFDKLDIRFGQFGERGEVYYRAVHGATSGNASMMFSSAQMNAVAVSVFLALNLMHRAGSFDWILLDDPIQNMDDYNVLGLVDLLRALRGTRQLVVSTHDGRLGDLMRRKLRPVREGQRTVVHHFEAGDEAGPTVLTTTLEPETPERLLVPVA
jgi:DNA repair exonuclease SbcCD ATPase subunit